MQVLRRIYRRTLPIAFGIVLRRAHVTLGVDAVVITPVSHTTARDADLERLTVRQRIAGHEPAITPTPNTDPRTIDVRPRLQPGHAVFEITQLELAEVLVNGQRGFETFSARGTIVADPNDVSLLREQLMPHV